jgi:Pyruvate/2-oxoacid:ferredoxin oxidoreductase delta subunit
MASPALPPEPSLSLLAPSTDLDTRHKVGIGLIVLGVAAFLVALAGAGTVVPVVCFWLGVGGLAGGSALWFSWYRDRAPGEKTGTWHSSLTGRGVLAWIMAVGITAFYVVLYWQDELGLAWLFAPLVAVFDALSWVIRGREADRWFMYGTFYTLAILIMGVRSLIKYRHARYHQIRTVSVMFFQLSFAFLVPAVFVLLSQPELYFSYFWPLDYDQFWPGNINWLAGEHPTSTQLVYWFVAFGAFMIFVATPALTYFFGKRWYCSWVCGCGGLAETAGDPYRQLSDKSTRAWKIERWMIHGILAFVVVTTALLWVNFAMEGALLGSYAQGMSKAYGFWIGAMFAGVIGVGFYPIFGARVWCRFGCPMAAVLGLQQRLFSRFRITTNGGQCISCGNCSTYCEMGIDVKWYAQRGQNVIRASCVGCGICAEVCPRGVLKLENGPRGGRYNGPALFPEHQLDILPD